MNIIELEKGDLVTLHDMNGYHPSDASTGLPITIKDIFEVVCTPQTGDYVRISALHLLWKEFTVHKSFIMLHTKRSDRLPVVVSIDLEDYNIQLFDKETLRYDRLARISLNTPIEELENAIKYFKQRITND